MRWRGHKCDRWLVKLAIVCVLILASTQVLLSSSPVRYYLSPIDRMEGENIELSNIEKHNYSTRLWLTALDTWRFFQKSKILKIHMIQPEKNPLVFVTINGTKIKTFEQGDLTLKVDEGDYLEIDATATNSIAEFVVHVPGDELINPIDGLIFSNKGSIITIGKIKFKT